MVAPDAHEPGSHAEAADVTDLLATAVAALGGAERDGQIEMAEAVAHAFDTGEHLAVQAGTGTGKSLAYLVPAIARAVDTDEPVVVSTATIALQRQLVDRDLPRLADCTDRRAAAQTRVRTAQGPRKLPVPEQDPQRRQRTAEPDDRPQEELFDAGRGHARSDATCSG